MSVEDRPRASRGSRVRRRLPVFLGAGIPATFYFFYVFHYAVNVPFADDWYMVPIVEPALHGHWSLHDLWAQYADTRIFLPKLLFVIFGFVSHLNEKTIMAFSAVVFIASYALLLVLFRSYLGRRLTFLPVFTLGIIWFSLGDVQNAFWSFQLAWYVAVFLFVAMMCLLLLPHRHRTLLYGLGLATAVLASICILQGFLLWPIGLICIAWARPWNRRTYYELGVWVLAAIATLAVYLPGYQFGVNGCFPKTDRCTISYSAQHPGQLARFVALLVGNVLPSPLVSFQPAHVGAREVLGAVILVVAGFVVVQSIRQRRTGMSPLPLLLILFAVCFDLTIGLGRSGEGVLGAINNNNRYTMPNYILLVGIFVYAWSRISSVRDVVPLPVNFRACLRTLGCLALTAFLITEVVVTTRFGISHARATNANRTTTAQFLANEDRIPASQVGCYATYFAGFDPNVFPRFLLWSEMIRRDHLTVSEPGTRRRYEAKGPPYFAACGPPAAPLPAGGG